MKFDISTHSIGNGRLVQTVTTHFNEQHQQVHRTVMDTREQQMRQALLDLGWTPPISAENAAHCPKFDGKITMRGQAVYFEGSLTPENIIHIAAHLQRKHPEFAYKVPAESNRAYVEHLKGFTREQLHAVGWTDELLNHYGYVEPAASYVYLAAPSPLSTALPADGIPAMNTKGTTLRVLDSAIHDLQKHNDALTADKGRRSERIDKTVAALIQLSKCVEGNYSEYQFINERCYVEHYERDAVSGEVTFHRKANSEWPEWVRDFYNKHQAPCQVSLKNINKAYTEMFYPAVYLRSEDGSISCQREPMCNWPTWVIHSEC